MSSPTLVDDTDHVVQYTAGWTWDQLVAEVDHTRHGAARSGLKASLGFFGSGVQVLGTVGSTSQFGRPTTSYTIDGVVVGTFTAPESDTTQYNVTFFSKLDLTLDDHEVEITYTSDTPNTVYWLDYFLIYQSSSPVITNTPTSQMSSPSSPSDTGARSTSSSSPSSSQVRHSPTTQSSTISSRPQPEGTSADPSTSHPLQSDTSNSTVIQITTFVSVLPNPDVTSGSVPDLVGISSSRGNGSTTPGPTASIPTTPASTPQDHRTTTPLPIIAAGIAVGVIALLLLLVIIYLLRRRIWKQRTQLAAFNPGLFMSSRDMDSVVRPPPAPNAPAISSGQSPWAIHEGTSHDNLVAMVPPQSALFPTELKQHPEAAAETSTSNSRPSSPSDSELDAPPQRPLSLRNMPPTVYPGLQQSPSPGTTSFDATFGAIQHAAGQEALRTSWYAPLGSELDAQALLDTLSSRYAGEGNHGPVVASGPRQMDSGLRVYDRTDLPPVYTPN